MSAKGLARWVSWSLTLIGMIFASQLAIASSDTGTLQVGLKTCGPLHLPSGYGFLSGSGGFGSYSPTVLTGGDTVTAVFDETSNCGFTAGSWLEVSGFSADPGAAWLTSITCNGVQKLESIAGFSYTSGIAFWDWSTTFGLSGKLGSNVSCTIVHN